jgi:hypothetical protein
VSSATSKLLVLIVLLLMVVGRGEGWDVLLLLWAKDGAKKTPADELGTQTLQIDVLRSSKDWK